MLADRYNADDLKKNATKFINKNIKAVCKKSRLDYFGKITSIACNTFVWT